MTAALQLHAVVPALLAIEDALIENGGELTPEILAQLESLEGAFDQKIESLLLRALQLQFEGGVAKLEAVRLAELAGVRERVAERIKTYVLECMEAAGRHKVETSRLRARIQQNSRPTIQWPGPIDVLPEAFKRTTVMLDGTKSYEAWKAGELPEGFVVDRGRHLRIS